MTEMIERVARALHRKQMAGKWELLPNTVRASYFDDATTAIKAMRDVIAEAGGSTAMIDAALKGTEQ